MSGIRVKSVSGVGVTAVGAAVAGWSRHVLDTRGKRDRKIDAESKRVRKRKRETERESEKERKKERGKTVRERGREGEREREPQWRRATACSCGVSDVC